MERSDIRDHFVRVVRLFPSFAALNPGYQCPLIAPSSREPPAPQGTIRVRFPTAYDEIIEQYSADLVLMPAVLAAMEL